jgi:hypothetical protein
MNERIARVRSGTVRWRKGYTTFRRRLDTGTSCIEAIAAGARKFMERAISQIALRLPRFANMEATPETKKPPVGGPSERQRADLIDSGLAPTASTTSAML